MFCDVGIFLDVHQVIGIGVSRMFVECFSFGVKYLNKNGGGWECGIMKIHKFTFFS